MPAVKIVYFQEASGNCPFLRWVTHLHRNERLAIDAVLGELSDQGSNLRMPFCKPLKDGIHELRRRVGRTRLRVFFFFHAGVVTILSHGTEKKGSAVDREDIETAKRRRSAFLANPADHTFREEK